MAAKRSKQFNQGDGVPLVKSKLKYKMQAGEKNTLPSETIPNEALSVREMLVRFQNGTLIGFKPQQYYEDYEDVPIQMRPNFDLTDIDDVRNELEFINRKMKENGPIHSSSRTSGDNGDSSGPDPKGERPEEHRETGEAQPRTGKVSS